MDIDIDDEELNFSEDENDELQNQSNGPWQCGLTSVEERVWAIFGNETFTDITLTFPGTDKKLDAHRLILAISSPVFEGILYGPMRTEGRNVELHGDDPLAMECVIAHCYGAEHLEIPDMDTALEIYKLADKYILDELKKYCCQHIVCQMSKDNVKDVIEFAERFNFIDLKSNCLPYLKEMFDDIQDKYGKSKCFEDEPDNTVTSAILMDVNDDWIDGLLSEVNVEFLDFHESWQYPESPLIGNRLSIIFASRRYYLDNFFGCIEAETVHQFRLEHFGWNSSTLELCLSVTDLNHSKRVIEAINHQNRFEKHLIAIHIRCEEVWPRNWSPIPIERTHRPSMLLISDADDDRITWVIEAVKALLPQSEGSFTKVFAYNGRYKRNGDRKKERLKLINILKLPGSRFTLNGLLNMLEGLYSSGVMFTKILLQSPNIDSAQQDLFQHYHEAIQCFPMEHNFFRKVFEDFPIIGY